MHGFASYFLKIIHRFLKNYLAGAPSSPSIEGNARRWNKSSFSGPKSGTAPDSLDPLVTLPPPWTLDTGDSGENNVESHLCSEVSMVVLDTICVVEQVVAANDNSTSLLASVLRVMLHAMNTTQSVDTLHHLFSIQRSLVSKYPNLLFDEATEHCAALCKALLRHCSSSISGDNINQFRAIVTRQFFIRNKITISSQSLLADETEL